MEPTWEWLEKHGRDLVETAARSRVDEGGFGYLDDEGHVVADRGVELYLTCRMTHVFALAEMRGDPAAGALVEHGLAALDGRLRDHEHGGWVSRVGPDDADPPVDGTKAAYAHAFVVLAAASATAAGHQRGPGVLEEALRVVDEHFWVESDGAVVDTFERDWSVCEPYRGANANMHTVEAMLAAHDVTGDPRWRDRALRITERLIHGEARSHGWRLPEHFDTDWTPVLEFNVDKKSDPFRPYGATIGHLLEWSRLCLHLREALGTDAPDWLLEDAVALFDQAVADGWEVDGEEGFVYTVTFAGDPVVRERMHWVVTEATAAAWELWVVTGEDRYAGWFTRWWDHARAHFIDGGSWRHELDASLQPAATTWPGRPDTYHAYQSALLPLLGERPVVSFAGAVSRGPADAGGPGDAGDGDPGDAGDPPTP